MPLRGEGRWGAPFSFAVHVVLILLLMTPFFVRVVAPELFPGGGAGPAGGGGGGMGGTGGWRPEPITPEGLRYLRVAPEPPPAEETAAPAPEVVPPPKEETPPPQPDPPVEPSTSQESAAAAARSPARVEVRAPGTNAGSGTEGVSDLEWERAPVRHRPGTGGGREELLRPPDFLRSRPSQSRQGRGDTSTSPLR